MLIILIVMIMKDDDDLHSDAVNDDDDRYAEDPYSEDTEDITICWHFPPKLHESLFETFTDGTFLMACQSLLGLFKPNGYGIVYIMHLYLLFVKNNLNGINKKNNSWGI